MFIIWMIFRAESLSFLFLVRQLHRVRSSLRCRCFFFSPCAIFIEISQRRRTKKFYLALLRGHLEQDRVDIDIPIGETRTNTIAYPNKFGKWHFIFSSWEDLINAKTSACIGLYWYVCFQEKMHLVNNGCAALMSPTVIRWKCHHYWDSYKFNTFYGFLPH